MATLITELPGFETISGSLGANKIPFRRCDLCSCINILVGAFVPFYFPLLKSVLFRVACIMLGSFTVSLQYIYCLQSSLKFTDQQKVPGHIKRPLAF